MPRYRQRVRDDPRAAGQPGLGRRRGLRRDLPRAPLGAAAAGHRRAAAGVRGPHPAAAAGPAPARCGRSTSSRGWPRAASRSSPSPTRRSSTASTRSTSRTSSSTATRPPRAWSPTRGGPATSPATSSCSPARSSTPSTPERGRRQRPRRRWPTSQAVGGRGAGRRRRRRSTTVARIGGPAGARPARSTPRSARPAATSWSAPTSTTTARCAARLGGGALAEEVTVNDVVLATIAGALRAWLLTRGEAVTTATTVRAMVPVSVYDATRTRPLGNRVTACFVDLPVGEPRPLDAAAPDRLRDAPADGGRPGGRRRVPRRHRRVRPADAALARRPARAAPCRGGCSTSSSPTCPAPSTPLYAGDARMLSTYPVMPLAKRAGAVHRADLLRRRRLLRAQRRP